MAGPSEVRATTHHDLPPHSVRTALALTANTSDKYVPSPTAEAILGNHISSLKDFRTKVVNKAISIKLREKTSAEKEKAALNPGALDTNENGDLIWVEEPEQVEPQLPKGLKTGLYDKSQAKPDSPSEFVPVQSFLKELDHTLGKQITAKILYQDSRKIPDFDKNLISTIKSLNEVKDWILCPTDKTNKYSPVKTKQYVSWVHGHLTKSCTEIPWERLSIIYAEAQSLLLKFSSLMDAGELSYIQHWIAAKCIPTPRLLIKDHKPPDEAGNYPTRLLIPATNFTQCFAKIGYKAIKAVLHAHCIQYNRHTITQSSHLKCTLERLNLNTVNCAVTSIDIRDMYPSCKFKLIKQAIHYYSEDFTEEEMAVIEAALEMLKFSMGNILVTFRDRYYEYGVDDDPVNRSLTIGGYDSA